MPQIFSRNATFAFRFLLIATPVAVLAGGAVTFGVYRSRTSAAPTQPVEFRHDVHYAAGIGCRYCHSDAERSSFAGIPSAGTCMGCHSQIWRDSPLLLRVRMAAAGELPLTWSRVTNLPDFAIFDHSIHVAKGFGCDTCHGRVDQMSLVRQPHPFHMEWCLDCHRNPERYVRPREFVWDPTWIPPRDREQLGAQLVKAYAIRKITDCSACHR